MANSNDDYNALNDMSTMFSPLLLLGTNDSQHNVTYPSSSLLYAQPWLRDLNASVFPTMIAFVSIFVFSILCLLYDYFRPTAPFALSSKLRMRRASNWFIVILCQAAEISSVSAIYVMAAAPRKTVEACGLTYNHVYVINIVQFFVKPLGFFIFGMLIDRFKKLKEGKYVLIVSLVLQALLNMLTGTSVVWSEASDHSSGGGTGQHSLSLMILSTIGLTSEGSASQKSMFGSAEFWASVKEPLFFVLFIVGSLLHCISEIVLIKLCAIWYRGKEERATIAGVLNIGFCFELVVAFVVNPYLYKIFNTLPSLLYASTLLLLMAAVGCFFISEHISSGVDLHFYMYLFNKQQQGVEDSVIAANRSLNLEQYLNKGDADTSAAPSTVDMVALLESNHQNHDNGERAIQKEIEESMMAHEFKFRDPIRLDNRIGIKRTLMQMDLWVYAMCLTALGVIHYGACTWMMNYASSRFHLATDSATHSLLVVAITLAPALSVWFSIVLNNIFARHQYLNMPMLSAIIYLIIAGMSSIMVFGNHISLLILFGFMASMVKYLSFGVVRYWTLNFGGAAHSGLVTAVLFSGFCVGNGIGATMARSAYLGLKFNLSYALIMVLVPALIAVPYLIIGIKNLIKQIRGDKNSKM